MLDEDMEKSNHLGTSKDFFKSLIKHKQYHDNEEWEAETCIRLKAKWTSPKHIRRTSPRTGHFVVVSSWLKSRVAEAARDGREGVVKGKEEREEVPCLLCERAQARGSVPLQVSYYLLSVERKYA